MNWGRLVIVFPVLSFAMCLATMVLAFIRGEVVSALVMATMCGVNLGMVSVIFYFTGRK